MPLKQASSFWIFLPGALAPRSPWRSFIAGYERARCASTASGQSPLIVLRLTMPCGCPLLPLLSSLSIQQKKSRQLQGRVSALGSRSLLSRTSFLCWIKPPALPLSLAQVWLTVLPSNLRIFFPGRRIFLLLPTAWTKKPLACCWQAEHMPPNVKYTNS